MTTDHGVRRPAVSVRVRITTTVALLVTIALAGAGAIVYVIERSRVDASIQREADQELDEFAKLSNNGIDPETGDSFDSISRLLETFMVRNVPDNDELLVGWVAGAPSVVSPRNDPLVTDARFLESAAPLAEDGGTDQFETQHGEIRITSQPLRRGDERGALLIVAYVDEDRGELVSTMRTYAVVSLLALLLISTVAAWQSGRLLRPLRALRGTADDIGANDLSQRIPESGNDDITALTHTFNKMLDRLESSFTQQRFFLDAAGHELRTPLTVLRGHLELLNTTDPTDVDDTRVLLLDEVDRMSRLVADLILLAKTDRPDFLKLEATQPDQLINSVLAKARGLGDRDWQLVSVPPSQSLALHLDPQRITQALLALCDNAVKHSERGSEITLGARVEDSDLLCWVADRGPGVAVQDRERIFGRFERAAVPSGDEGFGLGLSIVYAVVQAHGGHVSVSDNPAGGACFQLTIPIVRRSPAPPSDIAPTRKED